MPDERVELELVRILVRPVIQRRVNGKVVGEVVNEEAPCFSVESFADLWAEMERQVAEINAAQPNRSARRAAKGSSRN